MDRACAQKFVDALNNVEAVGFCTREASQLIRSATFLVTLPVSGAIVLGKAGEWLQSARQFVPIAQTALSDFGGCDDDVEACSVSRIAASVRLAEIDGLLEKLRQTVAATVGPAAIPLATLPLIPGLIGGVDAIHGYIARLIDDMVGDYRISCNLPEFVLTGETNSTTYGLEVETPEVSDSWLALRPVVKNRFAVPAVEVVASTTSDVVPVQLGGLLGGARPLVQASCTTYEVKAWRVQAEASIENGDAAPFTFEWRVDNAVVAATMLDAQLGQSMLSFERPSGGRVNITVTCVDSAGLSLSNSRSIPLPKTRGQCIPDIRHLNQEIAKLLQQGQPLIVPGMNWTSEIPVLGRLGGTAPHRVWRMADQATRGR